MKKRKRQHTKGYTPSREKLDDLRNIKQLQPDDIFHLKCVCCGDCCRHVARSVLLEPYDLFRIAKDLKRKGHAIRGIEDVLMEYAEIQTLGDVEYPVFMLKTGGPKDTCVFLKDGRCSIHEVKPKACRLYPLGVWPNDAMTGFDYFLVSQRPRHANDPAVRAGDWMDANFSSYEREIVHMDAQSAKDLAPLLIILKRAGADWNRVLQPLILFKYVCYELNEPFMPQYMRNMDWLKRALTVILNEKRGK